MEKIVQLPNKILREVSKEVKLPLSNEDKRIAEEMIKYIDESQMEGSPVREGIGIAAIQMGHLKRMFYVNVPGAEGEEPFKEFFINPKFTAISKGGAALEFGEGCLSVPVEHEGQSGLVHRKYSVEIEAYSYFSNKIIKMKKAGFDAIVLQHEMDHLDGKLFIDRINNSDPMQVLDDEEII